MSIFEEYGAVNTENFSDSNTDDSFTAADSNSFLSI